MMRLVLASSIALLTSEDALGASWAEGVRARLAKKDYLQLAEILERNSPEDASDYEMRNLLAGTLERMGRIGRAARH